jgi:hypothetical protein
MEVLDLFHRREARQTLIPQDENRLVERLPDGALPYEVRGYRNSRRDRQNLDLCCRDLVRDRESPVHGIHLHVGDDRHVVRDLPLPRDQIASEVCQDQNSISDLQKICEARFHCESRK